MFQIKALEKGRKDDRALLSHIRLIFDLTTNTEFIVVYILGILHMIYIFYI